MSWLAGPPVVPSLIAFVVGAFLGRFLNRCIDRFPRHESFGRQIDAVLDVPPYERTLRRAQSLLHRLPVVGRLVPGNPFRRSRRHDLRLAAVELTNGLLFAALVWLEFPAGFVPGRPDPFAVEGFEFLAPANGSLSLQVVRLLGHFMLVQALIVASVIDLDRMIIPDGSTLPAMWVAVALSVSGGLHLVPVWYEDTSIAALLGFGGDFQGGIEVPAWIREHPSLAGLAASLAGLAVGGGIVWAVRLVGEWALGREAMGFGDVILMAMVGAFVGWQPVLVAFFLAPACALVVIGFALLTGGSREFPYGPWLSLATVLVLLGWHVIWPAAGRFFVMGRLIPIVGLGMLVLLAAMLAALRLLRGDDVWWEDGRDWTSADQLHYQSQQKAGRTAGSWPGSSAGEWPGVVSGRGTLGHDRWRAGNGPVAARWPRSRGVVR